MEKPGISDLPYFLVGAVVALQEELGKAADYFIRKGEEMTPEGRKRLQAAKKGLVSKSDDFSVIVSRTIKRVLENAGLVTKADIEGIVKRINELEKKKWGQVLQ
ncbi:MAG: hypothetical protein PHP64_08675 [Actinomycetota bacterium]|nr:hypothetical protein [Actinomycetota bacterium]